MTARLAVIPGPAQGLAAAQLSALARLHDELLALGHLLPAHGASDPAGAKARAQRHAQNFEADFDDLPV